MCGLVGVAGHTTLAAVKVFKDLLTVDVVRGAHSTGVLAITTQGMVDIVKKAGPPTELFDSGKFGSVLGKSNALLLGHNRWATTGRINAANAHPFEFDDVFGAHNGTLRQQSLLPDHQDFEVDSENIFHSIQLDGFAKTVGKLHGAYALSWYDMRDDTLNFARNSERTLFYCKSRDNGQLFWASEAWMLTGVLGRQGIQHGKIMAFEVDMHYCFDMVALSKGHATSVPKPRVTKAVGHKPPVVAEVANKWASKTIVKVVGEKRKKYHSIGDSVAFSVTNSPAVMNKRVAVEGTTDKGEEVITWLTEPQAAECDAFTKGTALIGKVVSQAPNKGAKTVISADSVTKQVVELLGFRGEVLTENEWRRRTKLGCAWCADVADETIEWLSVSEFLCNNCVMDDNLKDFLVQ